MKYLLLLLTACTNVHPPEQVSIQIPTVEKGKRLIYSKGCVACHTTDGSKLVGPSFKGIYGKEVNLSDDTKTIVDDIYIRESIENPSIKIVAGFPPSMPPYKGLVGEEEILSIIEYIKSLK